MPIGKAAIAAFLAVLVTSWSASASGAKTPLQGTMELVEAVKDTDKTGSSMQRVRTYFDYDRLVEVPIQPHKEKLNKDQLARYQRTFRELLEMAPLIASIGGSGKLEYKVGKPIKKPDGVQVSLSAYDGKNDMNTEIKFYWRQIDKAWFVTDVTLDGASLVKGYQNQFGRILNKEGAEGLIQRLEKRLVETKSQGAG